MHCMSLLTLGRAGAKVSRNGNHLTPKKSEALHKRLIDWAQGLDDALRVHGETTSAVYVLQSVHVRLSRADKALMILV
jgi:hypothetical protein